MTYPIQSMKLIAQLKLHPTPDQTGALAAAVIGCIVFEE
jgi:uncharacterized protein CbrC (UPF0167 family)